VNQSQPTVDHEEFESLLPWYVNETLDEAEQTRVQRHIEQCATCRDNVDMLLEVRRTVRSGSPAPLVPPPDTARLLEAIEESDRAGAHRTWSWIAVAATFTLVAITMAWQLGPRPGNTPTLFETVTSPAVDQSINYVLEVRFAPGASVESHGAFFESIGAGKLAVPLGENTYRMALGLGPLSLAELEQYAERIESRPEVAAARFVAVQLPVE
jgi:hypothetical protein